MSYISKISIGTAQFGLDYGITNNNGRILMPQVLKILQIAQENNINKIDTARSYGQGETIIGKAIKNHKKFKITSKFTVKNDLVCNNDALKKWNFEFLESLKKLNTKKLDTLLIHNSKDVMGRENNMLFDWLNGLKAQKLINKIGISIYTKKDLDNVEFKDIDVVQLPLSIYDQRLLLDGTLKNLHKNGITVQSRSVFLQGLILQSADKWPNFLSNEFKYHHRNCQKYLTEANLNYIQAALYFPLKCKYVDSLIVGISSVKDFQEIINQILDIEKIEYDLNDFSWNNDNDLDPRIWNL